MRTIVIRDSPERIGKSTKKKQSQMARRRCTGCHLAKVGWTFFFGKVHHLQNRFLGRQPLFFCLLSPSCNMQKK